MSTTNRDLENRDLEAASGERYKSYGEILAEKYTGKTVEILFDSDWGQRFYSDYSINNKPTIIGEIMGAEDNCLDLRVSIISNNITVTKIMSVNSWSILSVSEYDNSASQVLAFTNQIHGRQ
jgi:hypothetical protein